MATTEEIVAAVIAALEAQRQSSPPPRREDDRKKIDDRHLKLEEFHGKPADWTDWSFTFKRQIKGKCPEAWRIMNAVEKQTKEDIQNMVLTDDQNAIGNELYDILAGLSRGDAKIIVRKIDDCDGFKLWHEMYHRCHPRTMGRMIRMLSEVTGPAKVKGMEEVEKAMDDWDDKMRKLMKEFQSDVGELKDPIKIALITNMMPGHIQEHVFTHVQKTASYDDVTEMIKTFVMNKLAMGSQVSQKMDMGNVDGDFETPPGIHDWYEQDGGYGDEHVNAVSDMTCHQCGGVGHLRRDCPTKGNGKGKDNSKGYNQDHGKGFGYGKSYGKGFGKSPGFGKGFGKGTGYGKGDGKGGGYGKNGGFGNGPQYGKGGGFNGRCHNCNEIGHRKFECPSAAKVQGVDEFQGPWEPEVAAQNIESVWVMNVEAEVPFTKVTSKNAAKKKRKYQKLCFNENLNKYYEDDDGDIGKGVPITTGKGLGKGTPITSKGFGKGTSKQAEVDVMVVEAKVEKLTRTAAMEFNEADVRKPLASAVSVAKSGNGIWIDENGGYIENVKTGERMALRLENNTVVYDVQLEDGCMVAVTLDSGAGCNVWPRGLGAGGSRLEAPRAGVKMVAANGSYINHYGQRTVRFRGMQAKAGFTRPMGNL